MRLRPRFPKPLAVAAFDVLALPVSNPDVDGLRAEIEALRAENARLRADRDGRIDTDHWVVRAFLHAPFPAIVHTDDGEVLALSDGFVRSTGYTRAEIRRIEDWLARAYGEGQAAVAARIQARFRESQVLDNAEASIRAADGRLLRWICSSSPPERLPDGRAFTVVMAADLTARDRAEAALRQSEARLRLATEVIQGLVYEWDPETGEVIRSEGLYDVTGVRAEEAAPTMAWWAERLHPDDRDAADTARTAGSDVDRFDVEYRIRHEDGGYRHVRDRGRLLKDEHGRVVRVVGCTTDVTPQRETEQVLRESEARFRTLADAMPQIVLTLEPGGEVDFFNRRWYAYTGERPGESTPESRAALIHPDDAGPSRAAWASALQEESPIDLEFRLRRADGAWRWHLLRVVPTRHGRMVRWIGTATDVEALKEAQAALAESEDRFRALADAVPQIVYVSGQEGRVEYLNARWFDYTGAARDARDAEIASYIHPDDLARIAEPYAGAIAAGRPFEAELRLRASDGAYRWHLTRVSPARDAAGTLRWYGTSTDIHDLRAAREALARQARLLDLSHDAIFVWHPTRGITYWNRGAVDLYGYAAEDAIGQNSQRLLKTVFPADFATFEAQLRAQGEWIGVLGHTTRGGRHITVESRLQMVEGEEGEPYILETTRDVTARLEAERQLQALNEQLEARVARRTEELQEANHLLGVRNRELQDFAYVASHDLQEPLRKIRAFTDLVLAEHGAALGEEPRHYLTRVQDAAARMSRLIADLLAFSRVTTKGEPFAPVDLNVVLSSVLLDLEVRLSETGGRVETDGVLPTVEADPVQMHQLLLNLVGNALKYRREGVPPVVRLCGHIEQGQALVSVSDNGIGFEQKYAERIFAPFQRLHARGSYEGTGMGLAIVRRIVERHGGSVEAQSVVGQGSTFTVRIPGKPR